MSLGSGDSGGGSFRNLHAPRHKPPPRLHRQPRYRVGGNRGNDVGKGDGERRDVYHCCLLINKSLGKLAKLGCIQKHRIIA